MLVRVNKPTARNLFHDGLTVYLLPNKIRLDNKWMLPCPINVLKSDEHSFDVLLANFEYYNCNSETGKGTHYYIEEINSFDVRTVEGTVMMHQNKGNTKDILYKLQKELDSLTTKRIPIRSVTIIVG